MCRAMRTLQPMHDGRMHTQTQVRDGWRRRRSGSGQVAAARTRKEGRKEGREEGMKDGTTHGRSSDEHELGSERNDRQTDAQTDTSRAEKPRFEHERLFGRGRATACVPDQ